MALPLSSITTTSAGNAGLDEKAYLRAVQLAALLNSQLQVQNGPFDIAVARLHRYTRILVDDPTRFYLLGKAYRKQAPEANFQDRIADYENSIALKDGFVDPYRQLGLTCRQQKQNDKALRALNQYL